MNQTTHFDQLPDSAMLRLADFASGKGKPGIVPASASSIWRWIKSGQFPAPIKISDKITAWRVGDIRVWLAQQMPQAQ
ncbi:MAG: AlpA family phage regulatory protein [Comamonas sp.]|nr:AlpA family phage regulatory protein [Comamonas sp.]